MATETKSEAQKAIDKVLGGSDHGWVVYHEQPAQVVSAEGVGKAAAATVTVAPAQYVAHKREGTTLVEQQGETPEQLAARIADWERARPVAEQPAPTEEQLINSAKATLHQSITAGARPAVDVDLTPAATKAKPKGTRLEAKPPIEEKPLSDEDAAGLAAATEAPASKTTGLGAGSTPGS